ncbi:espin-like [Rhopilema esculentum]|uniref:espin-like n=1 Tax=Rhopilema esculentum TaxID=499914 RepID=UPI0031D1998B|eukprot:gene7015-12641_t
MNANKGPIEQNYRPVVHVPKVDKSTGQPIPQWKQQLIMTKMSKKMEEEQLSKNEVNGNNNGLPEWKKEVLAKREQKLMTSEDPILVRKRKIKSLREEQESPNVPPWKKELIRKKIDHIKEEIENLERQQMNGQ